MIYAEVIKIITLKVLTPPWFKAKIGEQKKIELLTSIYEKQLRYFEQ